MTSTYHPRRCGCGHHVADPLDTIPLGLGRVVPLDEAFLQGRFPGSLSDGGLHPHDRRSESGDDRGEVAVGGGQCVKHPRGDRQIFVKPRVVPADAPAAAQDENELLDGHDDSSTGSGAGTSDAPTVEADAPVRVGNGVEGEPPTSSTPDDIVTVSISLSGDRQLVELVAALVIGGVK